jgi:hypothetical protein
MRNEFLDDDDDEELREVVLDDIRCFSHSAARRMSHNLAPMSSERDSLFASAAAAPSSNHNSTLGQGEDDSLLQPDSPAPSSSSWRARSAARGLVMAARAVVILFAHCFHSVTEAVSRLFRREASGEYALADPSAASTAPHAPLRRAFAFISIVFIARLVLVRQNIPLPAHFNCKTPSLLPSSYPI